MRRYLVTGAAGFIGSHVVEALLARGDHVLGIDNLNQYYDPERKRSNLQEVRRSASQGQFEFIVGDVRDRAVLASLMDSDVHAVIHLAAMAGVRASIDDPMLYYSVNVEGTLVLLQQVVEQADFGHGPPNFVFASTSSVYGATERLPFREDDASDRPLAPYPASKRAAELLGHAYHHLYGLDFTALRFFTVYGPRGRPDMMAYKVAQSIKNGTTVPLHDAGQMYRDWTFIDDIVRGILAAADRRLGYEVINLGRGEPVLLADFVRMIEELLGGSASLAPVPMPPADVARTFADITKARDLLRYAPSVSANDGLARFVDWWNAANL